MLKRIEIKSFRSCRDVVLDNLGATTVLVGRNAVGKTNILKAIEWVASTATSDKVEFRPGVAEHASVEVVASGLFTTTHLTFGTTQSRRPRVSSSGCDRVAGDAGLMSGTCMAYSIACRRTYADTN